MHGVELHCIVFPSDGLCAGARPWIFEFLTLVFQAGVPMILE